MGVVTSRGHSNVFPTLSPLPLLPISNKRRLLSSFKDTNDILDPSGALFKGDFCFSLLTQKGMRHTEAAVFFRSHGQGGTKRIC